MNTYFDDVPLDLIYLIVYELNEYQDIIKKDNCGLIIKPTE